MEEKEKQAFKSSSKSSCWGVFRLCAVFRARGQTLDLVELLKFSLDLCFYEHKLLEYRVSEDLAAHG